MKFQRGDTVTWTSQAAGSTKTKTGSVKHVVPAGAHIGKLLPGKGFYGRRSEESYVVAVPGKLPTSPEKLYWPRVGQLRLVAQPPAPEDLPHPSGLSPKQLAQRLELGLWIDEGVLHWVQGGSRSASKAEQEMWDALLRVGAQLLGATDSHDAERRSAGLRMAWTTLHDATIPASNRYVRAIKAYREASGASLLEAKDAVDGLKNGTVRPPSMQGGGAVE